MRTLAVAILVAFAALAAENFVLYGWVTAELQKHQP